MGDAHTPDARSDADANPERDWYLLSGAPRQSETAPSEA